MSKPSDSRANEVQEEVKQKEDIFSQFGSRQPDFNAGKASSNNTNANIFQTFTEGMPRNANSGDFSKFDFNWGTNDREAATPQEENRGVGAQEEEVKAPVSQRTNEEFDSRDFWSI